jgi:acyl-CoA thioesterase I
MTLSRRKLLTLVTLVLLASIAFVWRKCDASYDFVNLPPRAAGPWIAFGDSLTEGFGATAGNDYPSVLSRRIGVPIQNAGVSGETSSDGLKRLEAVENSSPRVVLLCFGGNDVLQGLPRDRMIANIREMIDRLQARGTFVVLLGIRGSGALGDRNAKAFQQLAREKQVLLVPNILDGLLTSPSMMSDYVHPNDAGYAKIAERVEEVIAPLLSQLK